MIKFKIGRNYSWGDGATKSGICIGVYADGMGLMARRTNKGKIKLELVSPRGFLFGEFLDDR